MNNDIVYVTKREILTTSVLVSEMLDVPHRNLLRTIDLLVESDKNNALARALKFPRVFIESTFKNKMGREYPMYEMNEQAYMKLAMRLSGYAKADIVQDQIIEAFTMMKVALQNRSNSSFIAARDRGKQIRHAETDALQLLTEYAEKERGKPVSYPLYSTYTQMTNRHIQFLVATKIGAPLRDLASIEQLGFIAVIDGRVERCILDGLRRKLPYKEIYYYAKDEVEKLVDALGFVPVISANSSASSLISHE